MSPKRALAAASLAAALAAAPAGARAGSSTALLLEREMGPRAAGLGGAYSALAEGSDALWWNPAGLPAARKPEAGFLQSRWLQDFGLYGLQASAPTGDSGGFGLGALYADYGTFELVDKSGATQFGRYTAGDLAAAGGYGRSWGPFSAGATLKLLQERIESEHANTWAADFGGRWRDGDWSAAAVLSNLGPGLKFRGETDSLPRTLRVGGAWRPIEGATLSMDLVRPRDLGFSARLGGEYRTPPVWGLSAAFRMGWSTLSDAFSGPSYGVGVASERWSFDFSVQAADGHPVSWIGMTGRFGAPAAAPSRAAAVPAPAAPGSPAPAAASDRRSPARVLADALAWYRRKVAEGLLGPQDREDVLRRLLAEFEPQGVDVSEVRKELEAAGAKR